MPAEGALQLLMPVLPFSARVHDQPARLAGRRLVVILEPASNHGAKRWERRAWRPMSSVGKFKLRHYPGLAAAPAGVLFGSTRISCASASASQRWAAASTSPSVTERSRASIAGSRARSSVSGRVCA